MVLTIGVLTNRQGTDLNSRTLCKLLIGLFMFQGRKGDKWPWAIVATGLIRDRSWFSGKLSPVQSSFVFSNTGKYN